MLDASQLGRLLKKGLYIEKRSKQAVQHKPEPEPDYTPAIRGVRKQFERQRSK